ncbi:type II toxin-antitoxin system RelE/ParE family toxin [Candidatus Parcubacteria bacterium]|nr:type II toxin-antitoxin system RelE/ParE family toxin [Candidatus Parcubacteria bacterium]NCQ16232.1 type II toxin-antitoxin system RelE/ParE family toxin [Candidatus Falkowbacteria bacterium]
MSWTLQIREKVKKCFQRLPAKDQRKIREDLFELKENPYSGDIVKLENEDNLWRRRVGAYRIKFQIRSQEKVIYVYEIERRTSKTY